MTTTRVPDAFEFAEVILGQVRGDDQDGGGIEPANLPQGGVEIVGRADSRLGVVPLMAAAVDRQRERKRIEVGKEVGAAAAALHGRCRNQALVERLVAGLGIAVATEEDGRASHGFRSMGWGREVNDRLDGTARRVTGERAVAPKPSRRTARRWVGCGHRSRQSVCQGVVRKDRRRVRSGAISWGGSLFEDRAGWATRSSRRFRRRPNGRDGTPNRAPVKSPVFAPGNLGLKEAAGSTWNGDGDLAVDRLRRYCPAPPTFFL